MALDGIVLSNIVSELKDVLMDGRIDKIYQPQKEELLLTVRSNRKAYKLILTANSNYPRLHLSTLAKNTPGEPPMFCMFLRKHILGGRIKKITQPLFERIVEIELETTNDLGDIEIKKLIIEIMGRHSNIILTKEDYTILDSIKHIASDKSSLREILPNRKYSIPTNQHKLNPLETTKEEFIETISAMDTPIFKSIYFSYSGFSPAIAKSLCTDANLDINTLANTCSTDELGELFAAFNSIIHTITTESFSPVLYTDADEHLVDFYAFPIATLNMNNRKLFDSVSELIEHYYHEKSTRFNVSQKTSDIKKLLHTFIDRTVRKQSIQQKAIEESKDSEIYKVYGELLTAYSYSVPANSKEFTTTNYYTEPYEEITIKLDPNLSAIENAQKYFKRYNKAKRTLVAAEEQLVSIQEDLDYLSSVLVSLDFLQTEDDIMGLRQELVDMGYLKKRKATKKKTPKVKNPYMRFKSSSGLDIYVGKNNYQNDMLTMKFAKSKDIWLHIKDAQGSHVIIRPEANQPVDEASIIEAAIIAAYYSKGKRSSNVAIDYTFKKYVKKVPNAKPGMVIYTDFKTVYVTPSEHFVKSLAIEEK